MSQIPEKPSAFSPLPELPPAKVTLGDTINHKRHLDECLCKVRNTAHAPALLPLPRSAIQRALTPTHAHTPLQTFEEVCSAEGLAFSEDLTWGNTKMTVMAVASASALVAQFYPLTFPDNIWLLGACVAIYFLLSGVLQYMVTFLDKDLVYTSLPLEGGRVARLHTRLPKGTQTYTLRVEFPVGTFVVDARRSVGDFYRKDGYLVPDTVRALLEQELRAPSPCPACASSQAQCTHLLPMLVQAGKGAREAPAAHSSSGSGSSGGTNPSLPSKKDKKN